MRIKIADASDLGAAVAPMTLTVNAMVTAPADLVANVSFTSAGAKRGDARWIQLLGSAGEGS
ncbi:MAG TPA: hypothetical protein VE074_05445, partial [Jatrophihabitantaceae bacterium]|nr:hypothetical protein [Jatrophihabitantaceae bacterium]